MSAKLSSVPSPSFQTVPPPTPTFIEPLPGRGGHVSQEFRASYPNLQSTMHQSGVGNIEARKRNLSHSVLEILSHQEKDVSTKVYDHWRAYVAEFFGTFFLLFIAFTLASVRPNSDSVLKGDMNSLAVSLTIIPLVFALGDVSGAHMNPAVTFCLVLVRAFPWNIGMVYWIVQTLGGFAAAGVSYLMVRSNEGINGLQPMQPNFQVTNMYGAFFIEFILSSFFFYTILATGVDTRGPEPRHHLAPLPIGFALGASAILGSLFGGVSLNPLGSLIPSIVTLQFHDIWVYPVATFAAALTVAIWYKLLFMSRPTQQEVKEKKAMQLKNRNSVSQIY
ncbi:hypothetical protein HMI54_010797 [Coelomomyces lativittatus]|nr:hypothetical protein HMI55_000924 [Coelomomyces lativittatus]KAJ1507344.1 hypothetical protein HMI56_000146 [Coelomomyces lativittatus]KAJ1516111.1 hypothetical protein HMI54_010797 [Coelomomyces lativittatus]